MQLNLLPDSAFGPLLAEERLLSLGPGTPHDAVRPLLDRLDLGTAFPSATLRDRNMADACLAGIWLYHDFLDESHRISQSIATATGSYWHAILHRREPDSWNSKYWFRRVGDHAVFPELCDTARRLVEETDDVPETRFLRGQRRWDAFAFVDLCEACRLGRASAEMLCRKVQLAEWRLLFAFCHHHAVAG